MANTIELLEAIGGDASLRHASGEALAQALGTMHASAGLQLAAASGQRSPLENELGQHKLNVANSPIQTGDEDDEDVESDHNDKTERRPPDDEPDSVA